MFSGEWGCFDIQINGETLCSPYTEQDDSGSGPGQAGRGDCQKFSKDENTNGTEIAQN